MAEHLPLEVVFLPVGQAGGPWARLRDYLRNARATLRLLWRAAPATVWVQLPQLPLLWCALAYRAWQGLRGRRVVVVADCHNAQLRPPWSRVPSTRWSLGRADLLLVHNPEALREALRLGWPARALRVLEDVPARPTPAPTSVSEPAPPRPWVLVPGSFAADEPVAQVLAAAELAPALTFVLTGPPARLTRHGITPERVPANVRLAGHLPRERYEALLAQADLVLGLTRLQGVQLSVCSEALGFGRPLVTADTSLLREMFGEAAELADPASPAAIAAACRRALERSGPLAEAARALAGRRTDAWRTQQLAPVLAAIQACRTGRSEGAAG